MHRILTTTKPNRDKVPGFWEPHFSPLSEVKKIHVTSLPGFEKQEAMILENVFSHVECQALIQFMNQSPNFEDVGVQGMKDKKDERIGSKRTSIWCPELADFIWRRIGHHIPGTMEFSDRQREFIATDWWQHFVDPTMSYQATSLCAQPIAISPLLRFMKYGHEGQHYAHYDAAYIYPNKEFRSLKSVVIYLTTNEGAATRFIKDGQEKLPIWDRKHDDWDRPVKDNEIIAKSECIAGNMLIFNHRICHDVQQYMGTDPRVIIRGDLVFEMFLDE